MWRAVKRPRCTEPWAFSLLSTDRRTPVTARNVLLVIHPAAFTFFPRSNGAPIRLATLGHFAKNTGLDIKKKSKQARLPGLHATIKKEKCTIKALPFHLGNFGLILFFFISDWQHTRLPRTFLRWRVQSRAAQSEVCAWHCCTHGAVGAGGEKGDARRREKSRGRNSQIHMET